MENNEITNTELTRSSTLHPIHDNQFANYNPYNYNTDHMTYHDSDYVKFKIYRMYGWYQANSQNKLVFEKYGGLLSCYICSRDKAYHETSLCLTIPYTKLADSIPSSEYKNISNTFIVCRECFNSQILIYAPTCYQDLEEHYAKRHNHYHLEKYIQKKLNIEISLIKETNKKLLEKVVELKNKSTELTNNKEIEEIKNKKLDLVYNKNIKLLDNITNSSNMYIKHIGEMQNDTNLQINQIIEKFTDTQTYINNEYQNMLSLIKNGTNELELMSQTKLHSLKPCPICYNNSKNIALIPCGHTLCDKCVQRLKNSDENIEKCPICRESVDDTLTIYID